MHGGDFGAEGSGRAKDADELRHVIMQPRVSGDCPDTLLYDIIWINRSSFPAYFEAPPVFTGGINGSGIYPGPRDPDRLLRGLCFAGASDPRAGAHAPGAVPQDTAPHHAVFPADIDLRL
ncbi:hypothetical protein SDC9_171010 [bioreactor metagenome]|uniref:Uncharacterized protein n=1 Tax=bioreactor metagenome TaxID=1076179 RepID=A0A645G9N3_9ZZZZ